MLGIHVYKQVLTYLLYFAVNRPLKTCKEVWKNLKQCLIIALFKLFDLNFSVLYMDKKIINLTSSLPQGQLSQIFLALGIS